MSMLQDNQQARLVMRLQLQIGGVTYQLGDAELAYEISAIRALLTPPVSSEMVSPVLSPLLSPALRERLASLCARLGEREPDYSQMKEHEAITLLARLQAEEEDLLRTAAQEQTHPSPAPEPLPVEPTLIRQLKQRWRTRYQPRGSVEDVQRAWGHFKQQICGEAVSDRAIRASQYEHLLAALASPPRERTPRP